MTNKHPNPREQFKEFVKGNTPYLLATLEKEREERKSVGKEEDALSWESSIHVAAYATFYSSEDLRLYSKWLAAFTVVLAILTAILVYRTFP